MRAPCSHACLARAVIFVLLCSGTAVADQTHLLPFPPEPGPICEHEQHAEQKGACQKGCAPCMAQKGHGKKGGWTPQPPHKKHHWWCGPPPPDMPILDSAAILRVAGPVRRVRFRYEQEAGAEPQPESGGEVDTDHLAALNKKLNSLEGRVNDLYDALNRLVDQLSTPAAEK